MEFAAETAESKTVDKGNYVFCTRTSLPIMCSILCSLAPIFLKTIDKG